MKRKLASYSTELSPSTRPLNFRELSAERSVTGKESLMTTSIPVAEII